MVQWLIGFRSNVVSGGDQFPSQRQTACNESSFYPNRK